MDVVLDVPMVAVAASGAVALFVYLVDRRRARLADRGHRGAIAMSMGDLDEVVTHVMLGVRDLDVRESDEDIPERLTQYLERSYRRTETVAGAIEMHGAMCTTLSDQEKRDIETTVRFARRLLDKYHPQDIGEDTRHKVWTWHPSDRLKERAREMLVCVSRFTGAPGPKAASGRA